MSALGEYTPLPHDYPYYWPVHIGSQAHTDKESTQHAAIFKQHSIDIIKVRPHITISDHSD